ncbi:hypothetical protein CCP3SC1_800008 [Gammaproteobacteria bacterium]
MLVFAGGIEPSVARTVDTLIGGIDDGVMVAGTEFFWMLEKR